MKHMISLDYESCDNMTNECEKANEIIDRIIASIPNYLLDDPEYQLKVFTYIYVQLSTMIEYDEYAANLIDEHLGGFDRDEAYTDFIIPASDIRGLVRGKAICVGYSLILKTILEKVNIDVIDVSGKKKSGDSSHVWNQVCLDGVWYNCDLTNDCHRIRVGLKCFDFLVSNEDSLNFRDYDLRTDYKECKKTISDQKQEVLINEAKTKTIDFKKTEESKKEDSIPLFIKKIFDFKRKEKGVLFYNVF